MYAYINGIIKEINPKNIILESSNIGYEIFVSNPYEYEIGDRIKIYISQQIREDSNNLYGFKKKEQKKLFLDLLKVKGVGPKSALAILASANYSEIISAINNSDIKFMKKFPGIGVKSAQQIILDLKGKLKFSKNNLEKSNQKVVDAILVLQALGYNKSELSKIENKLYEYNFEKTDDYVKEGLKLLINK